MLKVQSNIGEVFGGLLNKLNGINNPNGDNRDQLMRAIALGTLAAMRVRIHKDGKKTNFDDIGKYTDAYIKVRRKKYNRTSDEKIILSLTRSMENDMTVVEDGVNYAIGFKNPDNYKKSQWLQNGTTATTVKQHKRVIQRKSQKSIEKAYDSVARIEDQIADNGSTPELLKKYQRALAKYKKNQGREVIVQQHQRKAWKGYGTIYNLTLEEQENINLYADEIIKELFG